MQRTNTIPVSEGDSHRGGGLISILEEIQTKHGYLPEEELRLVAEQTGRSLVDVYGVASFFRAFSLKPRGKHLVSVCLGTACHVRGGPAIAKDLERHLGVKGGETTPDGEFTLETVNCLGACALGPVVVVDGHYFSKVRSSMLKGILDKARSGLDVIDIHNDRRIFPIEVSCSRCTHSLMDRVQTIDGHPSIRLTVSTGDRFGWLLLSSLYGSTTAACEYDVPPDTVTDLFCPHCHAQITGPSKCVECGAAMVTFIVNGGGVLQMCSRRGCKGHVLDLGGATLG
jgi:NADH:ubiquinone oxidoreductase subunit E